MARTPSNSAKLVVELNRAAERFRSADQAIRSHIDGVVSEHPNDILFLSFEDKRALKLYSCGFRCRHCAITKCGVAVWRARHALGEFCFRYLIPFDWIDDKEDFLVSSLVDMLGKMPRTPSLLVLALPRGCYEAHRPLVLGLAFIMELLKIREVHVFLSPATDSSYHFADLLRQTEEGKCRTVQDVAALELPTDVVWRTRVNIPLYNIVDILCTLTTSPIEQPSTTFVLARNFEGAVTYRTTAFLPTVMWKELSWSMKFSRMTEEQEQRTLEAPVPPRELSDEAFRPLFDSSAGDYTNAWEQENIIPTRRQSGRLVIKREQMEGEERRNPTRQSLRLAIKREPMDEEEVFSQPVEQQFPLSSPREQPSAESDPDSPLLPAKRRRSSGDRRLLSEAKAFLSEASSKSSRGSMGLRRVKQEGGWMEEEEEEEESEERPESDPDSPLLPAKRRRSSGDRRLLSEAKAFLSDASSKSTRGSMGLRRVKQEEGGRARRGMDEEEEEGGWMEEEESEERPESDPDSPLLPAKRRRSSGRKSVTFCETSTRPKRGGVGMRTVKQEGERARGGMDREEEEEEEGERKKKEESEDVEDRPPANPHGAVTVFLKNRHNDEQRRAIAAKCRPTLPDAEGRVERLVEELMANGDATEKLIGQWRRMGEQMIPTGKDASLLEALDAISARMTHISMDHPEWDPEVYFHDA